MTNLSPILLGSRIAILDEITSVPRASPKKALLTGCCLYACSLYKLSVLQQAYISSFVVNNIRPEQLLSCHPLPSVAAPRQRESATRVEVHR